MKPRIRHIGMLLGALFFAWALPSPAAMPSGVMVFDLGAGNIYDLTQFNDCKVDSGFGFSATICVDVNMVPNGKGRHTGAASIYISASQDGFVLFEGNLTGPASGQVSGEVGGKGKAKIKIAPSGKILFEGIGKFKSEMDGSCSGKIGATGNLAAVCAIKWTVKGVGSERFKERFKSQLNGSPWTLTIDVAPVSAEEIAGTGADNLGYEYKVAGKYNIGKDSAKLEVKGRKSSASKGAFARLKNLKDSGEAKVKFKVQGYKGSGEVPGAPM